jgi:D-xylose transport system substrate-binding protein
MRRLAGRAPRAACTAAAAAVLAACCGCGGSSPGSPATPTPAPGFSLTQVTNSFSAMAALKPLAADGHGPIAVLLPDTATASYFADSAAPEMQEAFEQAGLDRSQYTVQLSHGSDQYAQAKAAIDNGASVLILDARYSGQGVSIEAYADAHHVTVIDYDWLSVGGSAGYYVGFDSLKVGVLLGEGLTSCASAWGVRHPQVIVMRGASSDYNAALYAQGYDAVLARQFSAGWQAVSVPPGTWDPPVALSEFQQKYAAHRNINAALIPNDENAAPIISYLRSLGIKPRTFPTTGLDATTVGLQNILAGYQCGTVYKPIYLEDQAAAALALYVRAGVTSPALLNRAITDPQTSRSVPAVLLTPEWVTAQNMSATVIADKFVAPSKLCSPEYSQACSAAGISS